MTLNKIKNNLKRINVKISLVLTIFIICIFFTQCREISIINPQDTEKQESLRELNSFEKKIAISHNNLGFKIFNKIIQSEKDKNIFIAPGSISFALAMALNGANGSTKQAIQSVLDIQDLSLKEADENYKSLMDLLQTIDTKVQFKIANSIWYRNSYTFEEIFFNDCKKYFNAEISGLDFGNPEIPNIINNWVSNNTNGKIKKIVDGPIDSSVLMYIINAIYFKGSWTYRFEENKTREELFYLPNGTTKNCKMMSQSAKYLYYEGDNFQAIDLPYGSGNFSMTVFLPMSGIDINNFITQLNQDNWNTWLSKFKKDSINLYIPKFKLEYEIELKNILTALGMGIAFSDGDDFTRMYKLGGLCISKVKHKTFVDVNEEGTEAAGVTSIEFINTSIGPKPITMYINRPFVFMIRENESQTILFMGKIIEPKS